jgi:hypothetical protein
VQTDGMMLDEIDRLHDEAPGRAAELLREFEASGLPVPRLGQLAFLFNHVLGEKLRCATWCLAPALRSTDLAW